MSNANIFGDKGRTGFLAFFVINLIGFKYERRSKGKKKGNRSFGIDMNEAGKP